MSDTQINLQNINDITELKALKADRYDLIQSAEQQTQIARAEINAVNQRIQQLFEAQQGQEVIATPTPVASEAPAETTPTETVEQPAEQPTPTETPATPEQPVINLG